MEQGRTRGRTARGLENDRRILDAAIPVIAGKGVDRMTLRDVAAEAGLTYGALYGRYENVADLLADLWAQRLDAELRAMAAVTADLLAGRDDAAAARSLMATTPARIAVVETLIACPRVADLGDVVPAAVARAVDGAGLRSVPGGPSAGIGLLALALGSAAHGPIDGTLEADAPAIVARFRAVAASADPSTPATAGAAASSPDAEPPAVARFAMPGEPQRELLLNAALGVVARSGLAHATLRRISRASGYSHIAVYTTYGSLDALIVDLVQTVATTQPPADRLLERVTAVEVLAARLTGWTRPEATGARRLMAEFLLGALADRRLGGMIAAADAARYAAVAALIAPAGTAPHAAVLRAKVALRDTLLGLAVLMGADLVPGVPEWGPLARALVASPLAPA